MLSDDRDIRRVQSTDDLGDDWTSRDEEGLIEALQVWLADDGRGGRMWVSEDEQDGPWIWCERLGFFEPVAAGAL